MEIIVEKNALLPSLSQAANIVEKKTTRVILSHILFKTHNEEEAYIESTDLECALKARFTCQVVEHGSITVSAKHFYEIVRNLPETSITIRTRDNSWVDIFCKNTTYNLVGLSAEEFPALPELENKKEFSLSRNIFLDMIKKTEVSIGNDETRPNLLGSFFQYRPLEESVLMVSTDGHRLSVTKNTVATLGSDAKTLEDGVIIPKKALRIISSLLDSSNEESVKIFISPKGMMFHFAQSILYTRLIEGRYPDYTQVIPSESDNKLILNKDVFLQAVRRIVVLSSEKNHAIKIQFETKKLTLSSTNPDLGEAVEILETDYHGDNITVAFNARYILDYLQILEGEVVIFQIIDSLSPSVLKSIGFDNFFGVVMPMRI